MGPQIYMVNQGTGLCWLGVYFFIVKVDKKWQLLQNSSVEKNQEHISNCHSLVLLVLHYKKFKFYFINRATVSMVNHGTGLYWLGVYFFIVKVDKKWQLLQNSSTEKNQEHISNCHSLVLLVLHYKKFKFYFINRASVSMVNQGTGL